jgi:hypothetical protein
MSQQRPPLEDMTLRQLRKVASDYEVSRYSRMRKAELIDAIRAIDAQQGQIPAPSVVTSAAAAQAQVEASKFMAPDLPPLEALASVDEGLPDLPPGYGESRIVLMPRDPQWAYAYWDIPAEHKDDLRRQGGARLALRFYDVTDIDLAYQAPHSLQQYECDEMARDWYLPIPVSDRDYVAEIGYLCNDGRWLVLARSLPVHIPPVYPSDWVEDHFMTVDWQADLRGKTLMTLRHPSRVGAVQGIYDRMYVMSQEAEAQRVAGSLYGSMQHVPGSGQHVAGSIQQVGEALHVAGSIQHVPGSLMAEQAMSSYVFPSGAGLWATAEVPMGSVPTMSGYPLTMSGLTMSGFGLGFSASAPPVRPRKFWLIADAELIVYGATEPDATVTIGGKPINLNPDGTFRFQMSFQDGNLDFPIMAVASDGEQTRTIHMTFDRATLDRRTNTKEEATLEWL